MPYSDDAHHPDLTLVTDFLRSIHPFKSLSTAGIKRLARRCVVDFFPKGTKIFRQGETRVDHLYLIQKGGVKSYLMDEEGEITLKDYRGEGEHFGALPIIQGTRANLTVETVEDTFCFLLDKDAFLEVLHGNREISRYYLQTMSAKMVKNVYAELRHHRMAPRTEGALFLFSARVADVAKGRLYTIARDADVQEAAVIMSERMIGSLLVEDGDGGICGIVTDKDIRGKIVAKGRPLSTPVGDIMAAPVQTIRGQAICFDALLTMIKKRIHHLAVEDQGRITRVITTHDIMVAQGTSPLYMFREIMAQRRPEGLYDLSNKVHKVVRSLIEEGAKAYNITRMITVLNDHILERLLAMMNEEFGPPPLPYTWLSLGSEGRREQTFKTDQDNAIVYADTREPARIEAAEKYFRVFAETTIGHLVRCGYPLCPGDVMASNIRWRQPLSTWKGYFSKWCRTPTPESVLNSTIFFDFRNVAGDSGLTAELREHLRGLAGRADIFQLYLARHFLASRPPMSFFRNFIVEKDGEHKNTLDIKKKGLVFFVDFARLFALKHGVAETNTLDRLRQLRDDRHLGGDLATEIIEAYEFLMHIRLVHQLRKLENDEEPDNYINPADLSDLERQTLKEAFGVINRMQEFTKQTLRITDM